jgi:hypothetical protein
VVPVPEYHDLVDVLSSIVSTRSVGPAPRRDSTGVHVVHPLGSFTRNKSHFPRDRRRGRDSRWPRSPVPWPSTSVTTRSASCWIRTSTNSAGLSGAKPTTTFAARCRCRLGSSCPCLTAPSWSPRLPRPGRPSPATAHRGIRAPREAYPGQITRLLAVTPDKVENQVTGSGSRIHGALRTPPMNPLVTSLIGVSAPFRSGCIKDRSPRGSLRGAPAHLESGTIVRQRKTVQTQLDRPRSIRDDTRAAGD